MKKLTGLGLWILATICWFAFWLLYRHSIYSVPFEFVYLYFEFIDLVYNTFIPLNPYSWIYWGISILIYLAYRQTLTRSWIDRKTKVFRYVSEAVISASLFLSQRIPFSGGFFTMLLPIIVVIRSLPTYVPNLIADPSLLRLEVFYERLSTIVGVLGLLIIIAGSVIFVKAFIHFLKRRGNLVTNGLYSLVRHPQYFGLILVITGTSILCMGFAADLLLAVIGYILLACYEEWNLMREHKEEYLEYKKRTPFIFPISCPSKSNEVLFSIIIAVLVIIVAFLSGSLTKYWW